MKLYLVLAIYAVLSIKIIIQAFRSLIKGKILDENFLMTIATIAALVIGEYEEAIAVMLFYRIGEYLTDKVFDKTERSIKSLMDIRPEYANLNGVKISPEDVEVGDIIEVHKGERIPLDGEIVEGKTLVNNSAITGESQLAPLSVHDAVLSGAINMGDSIKIKVTTTYNNSTVNRILELVKNSQESKAKPEKFITKFSKVYTPIVVLLSVIIAIFLGVYKGIVFLVISCPCALVLSVPLSYVAAINYAAKSGVLLKGSFILDKLVSLKSISFDKTGTLTIGDEFNTLRDNAKDSIKQLRNTGIEKITILSGDKAEKVKDVANRAGINDFYAELLPQDKADRIKEIGGAFVGDGINDAPVLTTADVGIAMGNFGTDAAIDSADVVLMNDDLSKIAKTIRLAKKTRSIVWQNISMAIGIKIIVAVLGLLNMATIWAAVIADSGVTVIAVLNSIRARGTNNE